MTSPKRLPHFVAWWLDGLLAYKKIDATRLIITPNALPARRLLTEIYSSPDACRMGSAMESLGFDHLGYDPRGDAAH